MSVEDLKRYSRRIQAAVLEAADPARATSAALADGAISRTLTTVGAGGRLLLVAVGKASRAMTAAALGTPGAVFSQGLVVLPHGYPDGLPGSAHMQVLHAGHPVPDGRGLEAARKVADLVEGMGEADVCLFLISGGSSALLPSPPPGVSLADMVLTTTLLLESGAGIHELNTVRKHLSNISGGRLARSCRGTMVTLAVSDVVGNDLAVVGSGPTVPDPSTYSEALAVLARRDLLPRVPHPVRTELEEGSAGRRPETPKTLPQRHAALIAASSALAVEAAEKEARSCGFTPLVLTTTLTGEAREAGRFLAAVARETRRTGRWLPRRVSSPPARRR